MKFLVLTLCLFARVTLTLISSASIIGCFQKVNFQGINLFIWNFELSSALLYAPSRKILVPRTSRGRPLPTSPGRPLKTLFDCPGNVSIWRPGDVLKWRPGDVLIWRSRDVPGRLIRDVPRTFSGRPLEDLESTQTWMSNFFLTFLSELIRLTKSKSISTLKVYWEPSKTSKMEHFLQN